MQLFFGFCCQVWSVEDGNGVNAGSGITRRSEEQPEAPPGEPPEGQSGEQQRTVPPEQREQRPEAQLPVELGLRARR